MRARNHLPLMALTSKSKKISQFYDPSDAVESMTIVTLNTKKNGKRNVVVGFKDHPQRIFVLTPIRAKMTKLCAQILRNNAKNSSATVTSKF